MERVHYRRQTSSRSGSNHPAVKPDLIEKLITQGIICGIIIAAVLLVCVIDTDFTQNVRNNLHNALSQSTDITVLQNFVQNWLGGQDNDEPEIEINTVVDELSDDSADFRIDEDVLAELNARAFYTDDDLKYPAPDPSAMPEPRE